MKNFKSILADKIRQGENVALYCYGIYASYMLCYLEKFQGVLPAVVIDNDSRKRGVAEFGVPVMPFSEAEEKYAGLQYFICSDDFKYAIIGDLLEKGVNSENIINYVPVEKKRTCLYFYNRLLLVLGVGGRGTQVISHCNKDSFKTATMSTRIPIGNGNYDGLEQILKTAFSDFENGSLDVCKDCVLNKEQYIVSRAYKKNYKQVAFYQATCADCLSHCVYCCVGGSSKEKPITKLNSLESYAGFLNSVFALDRIDDDFNCAIDMSERDSDRKIGLVVEELKRAGLSPLAFKVNSCFLTYSPNLAELMRQGMTYTVWSLDAGTRETYKRIKQVDAFDKVMENVKRYIGQDAFGGRFIVAKYLIVKGMNDNEEEFDAYLKLVTDLGLKFVSLGFDFNVKAEERDLKFIQNCYNKIVKNGLQLTYKNDSEPVTRALNMNSILSQSDIPKEAVETQACDAANTTD